MASPFTIRAAIEEEAVKLKDRYESYHNRIELEYQRNRNRVQNPPPKEVNQPDYWSEDKKFNPFYVLKHLDAISRSVGRRIASGAYEPNAPFIKTVPKPGGGTRDVNVYQIPDAAVSNYLYRKLLSKNKHRFSSLSYAYRPDRNVHFAIQDIGLELRKMGRVFVSEFDFSKFFDSIDHQYLFSTFDKNAFLISEQERVMIKSFLRDRERGIPQGCSISLFLANLSCWELDRQFENEGLRFARYADDTVVWSNSYEKICRSFEIIKNFGDLAGIKINLEKSGGISLIKSKGMPVEITSAKDHIEFLGYQVSLNAISIKKSAVERIKRQISYLLYRNLIQPLVPPRAVTIPSGGTDAALITALRQIRRYLYGDLTEDKLSLFLKGHYKRIMFRGVMSFYPLIDDEAQLKRLDKWLLRTTVNALRKRATLIAGLGYPTNQFPFNLTMRNILPGCRNHVYMNKKGTARIPSFLRIFKAIKLGLLKHGVEKIADQSTQAYNYE